MEKRLGKIILARFGHGGYQDSCIGIHFTLGGDGWGVQDSKSAWDPQIIEWRDDMNWTESDRDKEFVDIMRYVSKLLAEAKVDEISKLSGVPVEVCFNGNLLKSWRILTEVI